MTNEINEKKKILDYNNALDHGLMMRYIDLFLQRYPFLSVGVLGKSILGREIPIITLGRGERSILYVGTHHAAEWLTSVILLRYINEFCELYKTDGKAYNYTAEQIFESRRVYIVPMLDPDGVDYQINGITRDNILYDRVIRMNGGSNDLSLWQANARGVDLNHNYDCGFMEYKRIEAEQNIPHGAPTKYSGPEPESEPEVASICSFLREEGSIRAVISLHSQGEEIFYSSEGKVAHRSSVLAHTFSRMSGYKLSVPEGSAAYGGLLDWCIQKLKLPAFTIECGKGKNPLPLGDHLRIYSVLRELLFLAPTMI